MPGETTEPTRSYGCTNGDGRPYDIVMIAIADGTTDFLCMPCFVSVAAAIAEAMVNPDSPEAAEALAYMASQGSDQVPGPSGAPGRRNAPATNADASMFEAYDSAVEWDGDPDSIGA